MFAVPRHLDHDGWVSWAREAASQLSEESISEAFLASLTSRRLDLRSALSSFAVARVLPAHSFAKAARPISCRVCGWWDSGGVDLNDLSRKRLVYGGVILDDITYVAFDLEQFRLAPKMEPTTVDIAIGQQIVDYLRGLPPTTTAAQAARGLKMVKANADERNGIMNTLGVCGILDNPGHPGYAKEFVPLVRRDGPPGRFGFGDYPTWWWKGANGISIEALRQFLPQLR